MSPNNPIGCSFAICLSNGMFQTVDVDGKVELQVISEVDGFEILSNIWNSQDFFTSPENLPHPKKNKKKHHFDKYILLPVWTLFFSPREMKWCVSCELLFGEVFQTLSSPFLRFSGDRPHWNVYKNYYFLLWFYLTLIIFPSIPHGKVCNAICISSHFQHQQKRVQFDFLIFILVKL